LALLAGIAAVGGGAVLLCCWRRFELAIIMLLFSPWVSWILYANTPMTGEDEVTSGPASYLRILLVLLVGCCGAVQLLKSSLHKQLRLPNYLIFFGVFVCFAVVSGVYSIDRKFTLIRSLEFAIFFIFLLGLHTWLDDRARLDRTLNIYFWSVAAGILISTALFLLPARSWAWTMPDRFQGMTDHPNTFGAFCLLAYPILIWKYAAAHRAGKSAIAVLMCLTLALHVLSGSRSSLLAAILGGLIWAFYTVKTLTLKHLGIGLAFGMMVTLGVSFLLLTRPASMKRGDSAITTLTGRTEFWIGCLQLIQEKPIQGYGYGVAGKVWEDPRFHREGEFLWAGSAKSSLHNGYLSLAIGLGTVGLAVWMLFIGIPICQVLSLGPDAYKIFILVTIIPLLVLNFFESALSSGSQIYTSLVFWFILIIAGRLPELPAYQLESIQKPCWEKDLGSIHSTNTSTGLCAGYAGA